MTDLLKLTTEY